MLKTSRNSLAPPGPPLCVFCAVRSPIIRNQQLLARTIHSSGKRPEEELARSAEQRLEEFKKRAPATNKGPGYQRDPARSITTGSSSIDRAILSSFASRDIGASRSRGEGASGLPRIDRTYQQGRQSTEQDRAAQNRTRNGYQRPHREAQFPIQGSVTTRFGEGGYPGFRATTSSKQDGYQGPTRGVSPPVQGSVTTRFGEGGYPGFRATTSSKQDGYQGPTRGVSPPVQGSVTTRFGEGGYPGFRATTSSKQDGYQGPTRGVSPPIQGSVTTRFGEGGYPGFRATTSSQQDGYQGPTRGVSPPVQGSVTTRFGEGGYPGFRATTSSQQDGYQGPTRGVSPPVQGSVTARFGEGGYPGFRATTSSQQDGYQGPTRGVSPPVQGSVTTRFGEGGYSGFRATPPSQQDGYQGLTRGVRPPVQESAVTPSQRGSYQGFTRAGERQNWGNEKQGFTVETSSPKPSFTVPPGVSVRSPIQGSVASSSQQNVYNPRNPRDVYNSRGGYNPRVGYSPTDPGRPPSNGNYTPNQQTWNASNGYQPQVQKPAPFTQSEEIIIRPAEPEYNDYQKRRAGRSRDKSQNRLVLDEYESAILEEGESRKDRKAAKKAKKREKKDDTPKMIPLYLPEYISVPNLAKALKVRPEVFIKQIEEMGFTGMSHDYILNAENAGLIAMEYNYEPIMDNSKERDLLPRPAPEDRSMLPKRPPVVTIMGHVDHGKTSLLDWLRKASVAATEHGGITQHIGAFSVNMPGGKNITFLDTPGHEAFLTMRERGANVTDIVILVVAADDSVKPQTIEAIKHAKAANVPIIVAVNKIDKEDADVGKVKEDLARYGVDVEDCGGDTQSICVSAKTGQGMDELEEATVTLSEVLDMRAEDDGPCEGWVLEAGTKRGGHIATVLVRRGTLRLGDSIVAGEAWAKVRQLINEHGVEVKSAAPGTPVQVLGWKDQPEAGQLAIQADSEAKAKGVIEFRQEKAERLRQAADMEAINEKRRLHREMEEMEATIREEAKAKKEDPDTAVLAWEKTAEQEVSAQPKFQEVGFIVKGDVGGSVEAVVSSIVALGNEEVVAKVVRSSFGNVSEFDVDYAAAVEGYILCFNLSPDPEIILYARNKGVTILTHNIIYRLIEDVKRLLSDRLAPTVTTNVTGEAEIGAVFNINIKGKQFKPVAGCKVKSGVIAKNSKVKVIRDGKAVFEGMLGSLKNVKKDVTEMRKGECGMGFQNWDEFQVGDMVQCYETKLQQRSL